MMLGQAGRHERPPRLTLLLGLGGSRYPPDPALGGNEASQRGAQANKSAHERGPTLGKAVAPHQESRSENAQQGVGHYDGLEHTRCLPGALCRPELLPFSVGGGKRQAFAPLTGQVEPPGATHQQCPTEPEVQGDQEPDERLRVVLETPQHIAGEPAECERCKGTEKARQKAVLCPDDKDDHHGADKPCNVPPHLAPHN